MHSFFIEKNGLEFIENKFLITSLYLHGMLKLVLSIQIMFFEHSFENQVYDIKP
jgi:hypothetical protein